MLFDLFLLCRWQLELERHEQQHEHKERKQQQLGHGSMLNKREERRSIHEHPLPSFLDNPKHHPNVRHNEHHPSYSSVKHKLMEQLDGSMMEMQLVRLDQSILLKRKQ
jgi:hypothetical protein